MQRTGKGLLSRAYPFLVCLQVPKEPLVSAVFGVFCLQIFLLAVFWDVFLTKHVFHFESGISKENFFMNGEFFLASQCFFCTTLFHNYCYWRKLNTLSSSTPILSLVKVSSAFWTPGPSSFSDKIQSTEFLKLLKIKILVVLWLLESAIPCLR